MSKYHSTGQFRNAVSWWKNKAEFKGFDEDGNVIKDRNAIKPTVEYFGTVKLHGTNGSIILGCDSIISFHSKSNLLATYCQETDYFDCISDNYGFVHEMRPNIDKISLLFSCISFAVYDLFGIDASESEIKLSGEWCGDGIQKGVGISKIYKKFFVFGVKIGEKWLKPSEMLLLNKEIDFTSVKDNFDCIFNYPVYSLPIDFNDPSRATSILVKMTEEVEKNCPVASQLVDSGEPLIGEGIVWIPDTEDCSDTGTWFKVKGEKHSSSKVKTLAAVNPEKLNSIEKFVEYAVTENRLNQALGEVGLDQKLFGAFIQWVNRDIHKEEFDVLMNSNLTMKEVASKISLKARNFYSQKLSEI